MIKEKLSFLKNDKIFFPFLIISAVVLFVLFFPFLKHSLSNKDALIVEERNNKKVFKIGLINDLHAQRSKNNRYDFSENIKKFFSDFSFEMNGNFHPDIIIANGDLIKGDGREGWKSIEDLKKIKEYLSIVGAEKIYVAGNHESRGFSEEEWLKMIDKKASYYNFDLGKMRLIVLDGDEEKNKKEEKQLDCYYMSSDQLMWFQRNLENSENFSHKLVFIHFPILKSQYNFQEKAICQEAETRISDLMQKYKVSAVFSGHSELLRFNSINDINYFTLPGLEKSKNKKVKWFDCFYEIYVGEEIKVKMFYKKDPDQEQYETLMIPSEEFDRIEK